MAGQLWGVDPGQAWYDGDPRLIGVTYRNNGATVVPVTEDGTPSQAKMTRLFYHRITASAGVRATGIRRVCNPCRHRRGLWKRAVAGSSKRAGQG